MGLDLALFLLISGDMALDMGLLGVFLAYCRSVWAYLGNFGPFLAYFKFSELVFQ